jgi:hypothetical protein
MQQQYITEDSLKNLGITLQGQDLTSLLAHLNNTLEERVGSEITEALDDSQLQVLIDLQEKATDEEVGEWLQKNVPDFEQIIQDEIDVLVGELAENGDGINTITE